MAATSAVMLIMLAVLFLAAGAAKIFRLPRTVADAEHLGFSVPAYQAVGAVEVVGAAGLIGGLAWPPLGIAAAIVSILAL